MKAWIGIAAVLIPCFSQGAELSTLEHISAPGGNIVYSILADASKKSTEQGDGGSIIQAKNSQTKQEEVLLTAKPDDKPEQNLTDFAHLQLSNDAKTLYFEAAGWATSSAIHALDITSHKTTFVTDGSLVCVVKTGEYQDKLIVQQHKYFVQGGAYDYLYLYEPTGKQIGLVAGENVTKDDVQFLCDSMGI